MKILAVFIDMLRADMLQVCNPNMNKTSMDELLHKIGGTVYQNCYTPAPDTPRSIACFWSGKYPRRNGCNSRLKYPQFYLDNPESSILSLLKQKGYNFNFFIRETTGRGGILPPGFENTEWIGTNLNQYVDSLAENEKITKNSLTFIYLPDLHTKLDLYDYSMEGFKDGIQMIAGMLEDIFNRVTPDTFDIILLFSDHGFMLPKENVPLLSKNRTNILSFTRLKGEVELKQNSKLCSIMDFFPFILNQIGVNLPKGIDGIDLLSKEEHKFLLFEDHGDFNVSLGQTIEHWCVVDKEGFHFLDCNDRWKSSYADGGGC